MQRFVQIALRIFPTRDFSSQRKSSADNRNNGVDGPQRSDNSADAFRIQFLAENDYMITVRLAEAKSSEEEV